MPAAATNVLQPQPLMGFRTKQSGEEQFAGSLSYLLESCRIRQDPDELPALLR